MHENNSKDPLGGVWKKELEPLLRKEPRLKPMTLFEYVQDTYPGKYPNVLRTIQRRVHVATCNHNRLGPQSSQFWDQIKCNYPVA